MNDYRLLIYFRLFSRLQILKCSRLQPDNHNKYDMRHARNAWAFCEARLTDEGGQTKRCVVVVYVTWEMCFYMCHAASVIRTRRSRRLSRYLALVGRAPCVVASRLSFRASSGVTSAPTRTGGRRTTWPPAVAAVSRPAR
jgi:hypothetical protein